MDAATVNLQVEPLASGFGKAVFYNRNKFIGWVGKLDLDNEDLWGYEIVHTYYMAESRFADEASAVQALYEAWSGDWRRPYRVDEEGTH